MAKASHPERDVSLASDLSDRVSVKPPLEEVSTASRAQSIQRFYSLSISDVRGNNHGLYLRQVPLETVTQRASTEKREGPREKGNGGGCIAVLSSNPNQRALLSSEDRGEGPGLTSGSPAARERGRRGWK